MWLPRTGQAGRTGPILCGALAIVALASLGACVAFTQATPRPHPGHCSKVVSSSSAARSAVSSAKGGAVICLADGSYGEVSLAASKSSNVTLRARHPGRATIAGASLAGSHLSVARLNVVSDIVIRAGASAMTVKFNRISGGYFGIDAGPTTSTYISDTTIRRNKFVGPFGEDAIRLNRYHDGPDANHYGILIEDNEISGVRENGNHSDCLQSVWGGDDLYFRRNYIHDNRCQGFFIKDQPGPVSNVVFKENLMLRNAAPCDPPGSDCGQPVIWQVFGPTKGIRVSHNTIWSPADQSPFVLREGPFGRVTITDNVLYRAWSDWSGGFPNFTEKSNTICRREGTFPATSRSTRRTCKPGFVKPKRDDYRMRRGNDGIDWRTAKQHYGP